MPPKICGFCTAKEIWQLVPSWQVASGPFAPVKSRGRKSHACFEIVSWRGVFGPRNSAIVKLPAAVLFGVPTGTTSLNTHTALSPKLPKSAECQLPCFVHVASMIGRSVPKPLHSAGAGGLGPGANDGRPGDAGGVIVAAVAAAVASAIKA